jgi:hypothetical protein
VVDVGQDRLVASILAMHGHADDSPDRSRFDFHEKVRVVSSTTAKAEFNGKIGIVRRQAKGDGGWFYEVFLYDLDRKCRC